jgi:iron complex outermembrane receptor protein
MAVYGFAQNLQDSFVDLNSIPLAAIERIEVLKDGASAIYGSDADRGRDQLHPAQGLHGRRAHRGRRHHQPCRRPGGARLRRHRQAGAPGRPLQPHARRRLLQPRAHLGARPRAHLVGGTTATSGGANIPNSTAANPGNYVRRVGTDAVPHPRVPFANCPVDRIIVFGGSPQCTENLNQYYSGVPETKRAGVFGRGSWTWQRDDGLRRVAFNANETFTQNPPFAVPSSQLGPGIARTINITLPVGHNSNPYNVPVDIRYRFSDVGRARSTTRPTPRASWLD